MASDLSNTPGRNLPPVKPPSGRFIAQLFLVPGLIVFFVVLLVLGMNYMFVGGQSADQLLIRIDSDNPDIRWRGANDLAQILKRPESVALRTNVPFALDLCERLDKANKTLAAEEKAIADANPKDQSEAPFRKLDAQRNFVNFLISSIGEFLFPAGAPQLCEIIVNDQNPDPNSGPQRRHAAMWSLANLGNNMKGFKKLAPPQQALVIENLRNEAKSNSDIRRKAAKNALAQLGEPLDANDPELIAVDRALDQASRSRDQYLRELVAYTLNFWTGATAEDTLVRLTQDTGFGDPIKTQPPQK